MLIPGAPCVRRITNFCGKSAIRHAQAGSAPRESVGAYAADENAPATASGPIVGNRRALIYASPGMEATTQWRPRIGLCFQNGKAAEAAGAAGLGTVRHLSESFWPIRDLSSSWVIGPNRDKLFSETVFCFLND